FPESASVQVVSDAQEMAELIFQRPGGYRIGLRAVVGACEEVLYKDLRVRQNGTERPASRTTDRVIGGVSVWPNPNDGRFRVRVNLNEQADGVLRIYTSAGVLLREIKCLGEDTYELGFNESLPTGIYIIHLIFKDECETVKIAVNK
ncbi:MAG: T9SS type A sorting domain-containing protein, partial [Odoribacter sp.]|nr:T9SS type A sorting domain-containing protein [Odoribacter sp.]